MNRQVSKFHFFCTLVFGIICCNQPLAFDASGQNYQNSVTNPTHSNPIDTSISKFTLFDKYKPCEKSRRIAHYPLSATDSNSILFEERFDAKPQSPFHDSILSIANRETGVALSWDASNLLKIAYIGNAQGSERIVANIPLSKQVEEATLIYDVCFAEDFQFKLHGKIHGLGSHNPLTGGDSSDAINWSQRVLFLEQGHIGAYTYDQDRTSQFGSGTASTNPTFIKGEWHQVRMSMKLNDPNIKNGDYRIYVDNTLVLHQAHILYRTTSDQRSKISTFMFSTFHGGQSEKHSPKDTSGNYTTVYANFDNFIVLEGVH